LTGASARFRAEIDAQIDRIADNALQFPIQFRGFAVFPTGYSFECYPMRFTPEDNARMDQTRFIVTPEVFAAFRARLDARRRARCRVRRK
jgi:hypothetical protein